jgi:hypothetical protein
MLAPYLRWRRGADGNPVEDDALALGRGQLFALTGSGWPARFEELAGAVIPGTPIRTDDIRSPGDLAGLAQRVTQSEPPLLWLIRLPAAPEAAALAPVLAALEFFAQRGGGALLAGDGLPPGLPVTRLFTLTQPTGAAPASGRLLDDQELPVNHLREGEWGSLRFPMKMAPWLQARTILLEVDGAGTSWQSAPEAVSGWRTLAPEPDEAVASFRAPWPPGRYAARLLATGEHPASSWRSEPVSLEIRAASAPELPPERHVLWSFNGSPRLPRRAAGLRLRHAPCVRLPLGDAASVHRLHGWHSVEAASDNTHRRWIRPSAGALLGGPGDRLRIIYEDRRPRSHGATLSRLTLRIDESASYSHSWESAGQQMFEIPWPADECLHQVELQVEPGWSPKRLNLSADERELGILVYDLFLVQPS